jgi:hypothetical protein
MVQLKIYDEKLDRARRKEKRRERKKFSLLPARRFSLLLVREKRASERHTMAILLKERRGRKKRVGKFFYFYAPKGV